MARGRLSPLEIAVLKRNPYVEDVNAVRIMYTYKFKCMFMERYLAGERPVDIFRQAGFDVSVLGEKRIERATARWKALYEGNGVEEDIIDMSDGAMYIPIETMESLNVGIASAIVMYHFK